MSTDAILLGRIARLPRKTGLILSRLYQDTLLSRESLGVLLDAADLSDDAQRLLAFAAVYGDLRAAGVPVADTLAMARRLGVKINLGWSANRWRNEHDRLSRAVTLKRLAEDNVRYDLSKYEAVIDRPFPGYLIRTSRRLGMEGLRQRHCVASYHDQIRAGYCAIASVFIEGARWTVELRRTGNTVRPLAIGQIRSVYNRAAPATVRQTIHGYFNIALDSGEARQASEAVGGRAYLENARRVLPILRAAGVSQVVVSFDGSGDSGSISEVWFDGGEIDADTATVDILCAGRHFEDGRWVTARTTERKSIRLAIEELAYDHIDETGVDWYNNDGGYGELVLDIAEDKISLEVNTRFTETNLAFSAERDLRTGDLIE